MWQGLQASSDRSAAEPPETFKTWARHLHYTHNFKGDPPQRAEKKKKIAAVLAPETPWGETLD